MHVVLFLMAAWTCAIRRYCFGNSNNKNKRNLFTISLAFVQQQRRRQIASSFIIRHGWSNNHHHWRRNDQRPLNVWIQKGDQVQVKQTQKGNDQQQEWIDGIVVESRGSGWYSIQFPGKNNQVKKIRSTNIRPASNIQQFQKETSQTSFLDENEINANAAPILSPPPTIINLDAILNDYPNDIVESPHNQEYIRHVQNHASIKQWIVWSDLHCSMSSLDTCLEVMDYVHQLALQRDAGLLFLGDWWHHRGTLRVQMLNRILEQFKTWQVPMILIPGNHDQVTLQGHDHGLFPLAQAYRVPSKSNSSHFVPGPLIFSHPTLFSGALFIPHIRQVAVMESILQSNQSTNQSKAIFCHADVTGAYMNDLVVSQGGVSPHLFPTGIPIYTGHFHKPHVVPGKSGVQIEYVGSPYQTSLSEAHQDKALLVVDSSKNWTCIERIPLDIGRKHYRVAGLEEFNLVLQHESIRSGDRIVVSMEKQELQQMRTANNGRDCELDFRTKALREQNVMVEIREVSPPPKEWHAPRQEQQQQQVLESLTPSRILELYFQQQVERNVTSSERAEELITTGINLLEEEEDEESLWQMNNASMHRLELDSVTLSGFGPFRQETTYPLSNRGLVLLRGRNADGGGANSNGSGKTSLAMATCWALTGSLDARPMADSKVSDIINDDCKVARVSVSGRMSNAEFRVMRVKTASKHSLTFSYDGHDMTTQSPKETQELISEKLGIDFRLLVRSMFYGQHSMNGLLESTDAKFKDELSLVVPLSVWSKAATVARAKGRNATKMENELNGMIALRQEDVKDLTQRVNDAKQEALQKQEIVDHTLRRVQEIKQQTNETTTNDPVDSTHFANLQSRVDEAAENCTALEAELKKHLQACEKENSNQSGHLQLMLNDLEDAKDVLQRRERNVDRATLQLEVAKKTLQQIEQKWSVVNEDALPPQTCPTCQQAIPQEGQLHLDFENHFKEEVGDGRKEVQETTDALEAANLALEEAKSVVSQRQQEADQAKTVYDENKMIWNEKSQALESELQQSRQRHANLTLEVSGLASRMQQSFELQTLMAGLQGQEEMAQMSNERHEQIANDLSRVEETIGSLNTRAQECRSCAATMGELSDAFGPRGIQTFVLQDAVKSLESISQSYLDELSDGAQRLTLSLEEDNKILRRAWVRSSDGSFVERSLSSLSGGQWRRCSLAVSFGFANLISRRGRLLPSLVVLDEPLVHLDQVGRCRVADLIKAMLRPDAESGPSTVLLILQDLIAEELEESLDCIDEVVRTSGESIVNLNTENE